MSDWYEAKDEDIELDPEQGEVNILVTNNDFGNVYVTMTWDQLDAVACRIRANKKYGYHDNHGYK